MITFDDGSPTIMKLAAPILDDFCLPATFYISSGLIGTNKLFWVDRMKVALNQNKFLKLRSDGMKENIFLIGDRVSRTKTVSEIRNLLQVGTC